MKFIAVLLFISASVYAKNPSHAEVRSAFHKAATEEKSCRGLIKLLEGFNETNNPLLAGYKAWAIMMMAKYVFNPFNKLSHFSKGKALLEKCIVADNQSIELRFLRYTMQRKVPFFLQYRSSLKADETLLTKGLADLKDTELKMMISDFLKSERIIK